MNFWIAVMPILFSRQGGLTAHGPPRDASLAVPLRLLKEEPAQLKTVYLEASRLEYWRASFMKALKVTPSPPPPNKIECTQPLDAWVSPCRYVFAVS